MSHSGKTDTVTIPRWLFGDQLGPHFLDNDKQPVLLIESTKVLGSKRWHRAKAHVVLSAIRHRAAELGPRATVIRATTYSQALERFGHEVEVVHPTSHAALDFVTDATAVRAVLPARGYVASEAHFRSWADSRGQKRLLLEDFYRRQRRDTGLLMDADGPTGGRWNFDAENRQSPPRGVARLPVEPPWWPVEDEIDNGVRADLDTWQSDGSVDLIGHDGPRRFAVTRSEALTALRHFVTHRLADFGRYEDAMLANDPWMAHSLLSVPLNLGLLHPLECAEAAETAFRHGLVPIAAAEGFIRQIIGWRDYVWHIYWSQPRDYRSRNALDAHEPLPQWFAELDADAVTAACLHGVLSDLGNHGWLAHIPRLMVLGNWALQHGYNPQELTDWFHRSFVDGFDHVMVPNVVGMSQHSDNGVMATKPYVAGGSYINRMSDYCGGCRYSPTVRVGAKACPFTAGYWAFMDRHEDLMRSNPRTAQAAAGLRRLSDREAMLAQEQERGNSAP